MTGRFLGTVMAMLVITTTLAYNSHVSWRVSMQELRNQQSQLIYDVFAASEAAEPRAACEAPIRPCAATPDLR